MTTGFNAGAYGAHEAVVNGIASECLTAGEDVMRNLTQLTTMGGLEGASGDQGQIVGRAIEANAVELRDTMTRMNSHTGNFGQNVTSADARAAGGMML